MKWHTPISLLFGLLWTGIVSGQELVKSFPTKLSNKYYDYDIVGKNDQGIIIHHFNSNEHMLELLSENLRTLSKKELNLRDKNTRLEELIPSGKGLFAFYSHLEGNKQYLKARYVNEYLEASYTPIVLDSLYKTAFDGFDPFYVKYSFDRKYITTFSILDEKGIFAVRYKIFNDSLKLIKSGNFQLDGRDMVLKRLKINHEAKILAVIAHTARIPESLEYEYDELYVFSQELNADSAVKNVIKEEGIYFKQIISEFSPNNSNAYISASYKTKVDKKDVIGILAAKVEPQMKLNKIPFTEQQITQLHNYEFRDWIEKASIIKPKKIIPRSDGGMIVIMEGQYQYTRVIRTSPTNMYYYGDSYMRMYDQNHYFDILCYSISPDGSLNWQSVSPKVQVTEGDGGLYSSYMMFEANNVLKFLFNEDVYNNGNFIEYNVNPLGNQKRISLFNTDKQNMSLIPQKGKQISGNMVLIPSEQKRNLQFVLFKY